MKDIFFYVSITISLAIMWMLAYQKGFKDGQELERLRIRK